MVEQEKMACASKEFVEGEVIVFLKDYKVWGTNVKGMKGMFYRYASNDRCLVYVNDLEEWCEPKVGDIKTKSKGRVPRVNKRFCKRIMTMKVTY